MWKPSVNFVTLHYAWILLCSILSFLIIYAYGNIAAVDAFFFGCSANTESGLNTVDVKALKTYQQFVIYIFPIVTNLGFVNIAVVAVRLYWFEKTLRRISPSVLSPPRPATRRSINSRATNIRDIEAPNTAEKVENDTAKTTSGYAATPANDEVFQSTDQNITWAPDAHDEPRGKSLRIARPGTREEVDAKANDDEDAKNFFPREISNQAGHTLTRRVSRSAASVASKSFERIGASMFVIGNTERPRSRFGPPDGPQSTHSLFTELPHLSSQTSPPKSSTFKNLSAEAREKMGGVEYRSLKLLLKVVTGYFFGLHLLGAVCLVPWIHNAPAKYTDYLKTQGQDPTWWAFYSAQTMESNLGFTLTPDSMITFADATWPMLVMTFLAYAGNTLYPVILRLVIWTLSKVLPKGSSLQEPVRFLLDHPRRCYTLLFPSAATWALFGIIFLLNFVDVLLILVLDLHNPAVTSLPPGPRILAALFQAASSRHTGTSTFNLAEVSPAVQFSLLVMMYIAVFPIAFTIRVSNAYEEQNLGKYGADGEITDDKSSSSYLLSHVRNQLSFDLWYIFLGIFCICIAEATRIADNNDPSFSVFSVFFEVVSGYANVGLSLGYPTVMTSLSGEFTTFSKIVICAMMIRGRHRGLPYALDQAIVLPGQELIAAEEEQEIERRMYPLKRYHTS